MNSSEEIAKDLKKEFKINGALWKSYCVQEIESYAESKTNATLQELKERVEDVFDEKYKEYQKLTAAKKFEKAYERWIQTEQLKDVIETIEDMTNE